MKKPLLWLLPPVGFACGWILGSDDSVSSPRGAMPSSLSRSEIVTSRTINLSTPQEAATQSHPSSQHQDSAPPVTLSEVFSYPSEMHRLSAFQRFLDNLPPEQFASLYAQLPQFDAHVNFSFEELFFRRWAQVAPEAAVAAAIAGKKSGGQHSALVAWAERNPTAALAYAQKQSSMRRHTLETLQAMAFPKPGDLPPKDALRRINELHGPGKPSEAMCNAVGAILEEWAKANPEAAWQEALSLPLDSDEHGLRNSALRKVLESQAATDPRAAAKLLEALPEGDERVGLQASYVSSLAKGKYRQTAKAYTLSMPDGPDRRKVIGSLAGALIFTDNLADKEEAKALMAGLPDSDWKDPSIFSDFFYCWIKDEPESAIDVLLDRIPADIQPTPEQQSRYDQMFDTWCYEKSQAASEFLVKLPKGMRDKSLETAVGSFCRQDGAEAGRWAASLPPGPDRDAVLQLVASNLARVGVTEVTNWLNQLPSDSGKSAAIESFVREIVSVSPDDALAWLRTVPGDADRLERLKRVWSVWKDREAAQRWRDTSPELSAAERAVLR
ncbi:hypothetical protein ACXR0O_05395 [Verrucomicrobiota bacterium sgz303538]